MEARDDKDPRHPGPDDRRRLHFTPHLYIRAFPDDEGARALGKGVVFWVSPDIDFFPKVNGNAMANTPVTIQANIWNDGYLDAVGVRVEFFWFTPAPVFQPTDSNRINKAPFLVTIPAQSCVPVTCPVPWVPTFVGDGHECLVVQCNSFLEGKDGLRFPLHAELDRHVGQLNVTVSDASGGQKLQLVMQNPFETGLSFSLFLSSRSVRGNLERMRQQDHDTLMRVVANAKPGGPHNSFERELELRVDDTSDLDLGVHVVGIQPMASVRGQALDLHHYLQQRGPGGDALGRRLDQFDLERGGSRALSVEAPRAHLEPGSYRVLHFSQVTGDCIVGGYTMVMEASA
jgi:hypothetical protein